MRPSCPSSSFSLSRSLPAQQVRRKRQTEDRDERVQFDPSPPDCLDVQNSREPDLSPWIQVEDIDNQENGIPPTLDDELIELMLMEEIYARKRRRVQAVEEATAIKRQRLTELHERNLVLLNTAHQTDELLNRIDAQKTVHVGQQPAFTQVIQPARPPLPTPSQNKSKSCGISAPMVQVKTLQELARHSIQLPVSLAGKLVRRIHEGVESGSIPFTFTAEVTAAVQALQNITKELTEMAEDKCLLKQDLAEPQLSSRITMNDTTAHLPVQPEGPTRSVLGERERPHFFMFGDH